MLKTAETKIENIVFSIVIVIAAIAFPVYFLSTNGEVAIKFTLMSVFVGALYILVVSGFVLLIFNKKGVQVTSKEADKQITKVWSKVSSIAFYILTVFILFQIAKLIYLYVL